MQALLECKRERTLDRAIEQNRPESNGIVRLNFGAETRSLAINRKMHEKRTYMLDVFEQVPLQSDSVDEISATHVLEHASRDDNIAVLKEWFRMLKPGGMIRLSVPNMFESTEQMLKGLLNRAGFTNVRIRSEPRRGKRDRSIWDLLNVQAPYELHAEAEKPLRKRSNMEHVPLFQ